MWRAVTISEQHIAEWSIRMIQIVPAESSIALHLNQPIDQCSEAGIKKGVSFGKFLQRPDTNRFDKHVS